MVIMCSGGGAKLPYGTSAAWRVTCARSKMSA